LRYREQVAEKSVHVFAEYPMSRRHKFRRVHQVSRTPFLYDNSGVGEVSREVSDSTGMIEVDVRHDDRGEVCWTNSQVLQSLDDDRC
jgi:hypothetical protein